MTIDEAREQLAQSVPCLRAAKGLMPDLSFLGALEDRRTGSFMLTFNDDANEAGLLFGPFPPDCERADAVRIVMGQVYAPFN